LIGQSQPFERDDKTSQIVPSGRMLPEPFKDLLGHVTLDVLQNLADGYIVLRVNHRVKVVQDDDIAQEFKVVFAPVKLNIGQENPAKVVDHKEWHEPIDVGCHKMRVARGVEFR
jgi:hypothetical protein